MKFEIVAHVERVVEEEYLLTVEGDDEEEAKDFAYHIMSEYPNSDLVADKLVCRKRYLREPDNIELEFSAQDNDEGPEVA